MYLRDLEKFPALGGGICQPITAKDGLEIRTAYWPSTSPSPKGTICLLQGRAEFIEKYYEVIGELLERGFAVATLDWRGQGASGRQGSSPLVGHVRHFEDFGDDLAQFMREVALPDCPPPHYALSHSTGGLILLSNLPRLRTYFERAMLSAPLIGFHPQRRRFLGMTMQQKSIKHIAGLLRIIGRGAHYMLGSSRTPFDPQGFPTNPLTSDGPRYDMARQFLIDYPELAIAGPSAQWVHECSKAMEKLQSSDFQATIHTPCLIVTANQDVIVDTRASEYFASTTRAAHAISISGSRHEILMEVDMIREQFWAAFDSYIPGKNGRQMASISE